MPMVSGVSLQDDIYTRAEANLAVVSGVEIAISQSMCAF